MAISFEKAFGIHPGAMTARSQRAEIIATNIANADTPGYKAKDIDFAAVLNQAKSKQSSSMTRTHEKHFNINANSINSNHFYYSNSFDSSSSFEVSNTNPNSILVKTSNSNSNSIDNLVEIPNSN